ncbi:hypothetical protein ACO2Q2_17200 [Dyella sp. KRB-257]|uniref:hypothetical protein n=1 Tax=Dyella sp. KRB-257 TaxID=3400915 RepID=UPI003C0D8E02
MNRIALAGIVGACFVLSAASHAQSNGWSRLGAALGGQGKMDAQEAYRRAYMQGLETRALTEELKNDRLQNDLAERQADLQEEVYKTWLSAGLSNQEALALANAYRLQPTLSAIIIRARREGAKSTFEHAVQAYQNYNYQLADELVIAGNVALRESPQVPAASASSGP